MGNAMLLNCDMGESFGHWPLGLDEKMMPHIDMANIACGYHASDPIIMDRTVKMAKSQSVKIGAHPGYPDLQGFGRREMALSHVEVQHMLTYQIGALAGICQANGVSLAYVKPHGAMYLQMMKDVARLEAIMQAVACYDAGLPLMIQATIHRDSHLALAKRYGVSLLFEAFADRAYDRQGQLVGRHIEGAVYHDPAQVVAQATSLVSQKKVKTLEGDWIDIAADTLCIHGDNEGAIQGIIELRRIINHLQSSD